MRALGRTSVLQLTSILAAFILTSCAAKESHSVPPPEYEQNGATVIVRADNRDLAPGFVLPNGLEFVLIPGGEFLYGLGDGEECEPIWVEIEPFYMARTEMTRAQYLQYVDATGRGGEALDLAPENDPSGRPADRTIFSVTPDFRYPLQYTNWTSANECLDWYSEELGFPVRLAYDREWEWAALAGQENDVWYGERPLELFTNINNRETFYPYQPAVALSGSYPVNPFGLYDMCGNVREWVMEREFDCASDYQLASKELGLFGLSVPANRRSIRGGANRDWGSSAASARYRRSSRADSYFAGIRTVIPVSEELETWLGDHPDAVLPGLESDWGGEPEEPRFDFEIPLGDGVSMQFVTIEPGKVILGTEGESRDWPGDTWERPRVTTEITYEFGMGIYEVTQEQWVAVMGENPSEFRGPKKPVHSMTRAEVEEFLNRLNQQERDAGRLAEDEAYRLPNEIEWEFAVRAGTETLWHFGDDPEELDDYAWYNVLGGPRRVGLKKPNPNGLYDVYGNVHELCGNLGYENKYIKPEMKDLYLTRRRHNPDNPSEYLEKMYGAARGGGWCNKFHRARSASRQSVIVPNWLIGQYHLPRNFVGFRITRSKLFNPSGWYYAQKFYRAEELGKDPEVNWGRYYYYPQEYKYIPDLSRFSLESE